MKIIYMGTPDFAVPGLEKLNEEYGIEVSSIVTQPDRPRGRGQNLQPPPVKEKGIELGIRVLQTDNINDPLFIDKIKEIKPDAIVVVAFGQKLSKDILQLPEYGCINLHASLLPKYRGSSPIHRAIINGDEITGVTTMYMDEGWDTGDIIYQKEIYIEKTDTVGTLHDKLAIEGAKLLAKTLIDIKKGKAPRIEQNHKKATYAYKIDKKLGKINWNNSTINIYNLVRGVNPWPGAYTKYENKIIKVWRVSIFNYNNTNKIEPGEIVISNPEEGLVVKTGDGFIRIDELQVPGRKRMDVNDFLRGYEVEQGKKFN